MLYIGIDLHKDTMTIACVDESEDVNWIKTVSTKCNYKINAIFDSIDQPFAVACEAIGFYHWLWDMLGDRPREKLLADPRGVRARKALKRAKTDRKDAVLLAVLLRRGELPVVYVPNDKERALRETVRRRHSIARDIACTKNRIRRITLKRNLGGPRILDAAKAHKFFLANRNKFAPNQQYIMEELTITLCQQELQLERCHQRIKKQLEDEDFARRMEIYQSVPGIGLITAATIIAETGDITRFDNAEEIAAYAGLDPRVFQSADACRHGAVSKTGSPNLRWALQQAAWCSIRYDRRCEAIFMRVKARRGRKRAAVAVARHLLVWVWAMARSDTLYDPNYKHSPRKRLPEHENGSSDLARALKPVASNG